MEIGDTVRLKSGGPVMTINNISSVTGGFLCSWFTEAVYDERWFAETAVVPVNALNETIPQEIKKKR